jgi:hypothetical protein
MVFGSLDRAPRGLEYRLWLLDRLAVYGVKSAVRPFA